MDDATTDPVVVVGAGYAGVMAANRLAGRGVPVTLIAARGYFVERIRLHQVGAGLRDHARVDLASLLHRDVRVVPDTACRILPEEHAVYLDSGARLAYSQLVLAVGAGADDGGLAVTDEEAALRTRAALESAPDAAVAVIGGGLTGIETACALAVAGRRVTLHVLRPLPGRDGAAHRHRMDTLGIRIAVDADPVPGSIVLRSTGFRASSLAVDSGLPVDEGGLLMVNGDLSVPGHADVFGAGDGVSLDSTGWTHLRAACATAMPLGAHAADSIAARRRGLPGPQFSLGYLARAADLGDGIAYGQLVDRRDRTLPFGVGGRVAGWTKEALNKMTLRWIRGEARRVGSYRWLSAGSTPVREPVRVA